MEELLLKINQIFDDLNPTERKIASFILVKQYDLMHMSIRQLSEATGVSQAAWVRFFKRLGFTGLKAIKQCIGDALLQNSRDHDSEQQSYIDICRSNVREDLCQSVLEEHVLSLTQTNQVLDFEQLEKAVDAIIQAKSIAFFGVGSSALVANDAQYKFVRLGVNAVAFMDLHMQLTYAATMTEQDVAVIISNSGCTKDMLDVMETAKNKGATIIALTKYGKNYLSKSADILLNISTPEVSTRSSAMGSRIAMLLLIDYLFVCVANKSFDKYEQNLTNSRLVLNKRKKQKNANDSREGKQFENLDMHKTGAGQQ